MRYKVGAGLLAETFALFRQCGGGRRECQVLWTSAWDDLTNISHVVHPNHLSHSGGFELASDWINRFWLELAHGHRGIRVQVHTHPGEAFHSRIDDDYPIIHTVGFLSLVIPDFGLGPVGLNRAHLAEIGTNGEWQEVKPDARLEIIR